MWWTLASKRILYPATLVFVFSSSLFAEAFEITSPTHSSSLEKVLPRRTLDETVDSVLSAVAKGGSLGLCSPEMAEAGNVVRNLVFYKASSLYKTGDANALHHSNQGVEAYFKDFALKSRYGQNFALDFSAFVEKYRSCDSAHSVSEANKAFYPESGRGPHLELRTKCNAYEIALEVTNGNTYRAVALVGALGHDDIRDLKPESNLFARGSVGEKMDQETLDRFSKASKQCVEEPGSDFCQGAFGTFNYHVNFGFFLGCELVKHGFDKAYASKLFTDTTVGTFLNDEFIKNDLACRKTEGFGPFCQYEFNLCTDVPKMLGYFYKKNTILKWLVPNAEILLKEGYRTPFQFEPASKKELLKSEKATRNQKIREAYPVVAQWTETELNAAIANLDYRLMHLEYGSKQAEVGAKRGAEVCQEYRDSVLTIEGDARTLISRGNVDSSEPTPKNRVPKDWPKFRTEQAWTLAQEFLRNNTGVLGYEGDSKPLSTQEVIDLAIRNNYLTRDFPAWRLSIIEQLKLVPLSEVAAAAEALQGKPNDWVAHDLILEILINEPKLQEGYFEYFKTSSSPAAKSLYYFMLHRAPNSNMNYLKRIFDYLELSAKDSPERNALFPRLVYTLTSIVAGNEEAKPLIHRALELALTTESNGQNATSIQGIQTLIGLLPRPEQDEYKKRLDKAALMENP